MDKQSLVNNTMNKIKAFFLELFFPSFCLGCNKEGTHLCQDCKSLLEISEYNYCLCSKNPLRLTPDNQSGKCSRCKDKKLSGLYFALPYKEKLLTKKLIYSFKYRYLKSLAKNLSDIVIEHLFLAGNNKEHIWINSVLVPVPMEIKKMKDRGYNQAHELAKELSKVIKVPVVTDSLIKTKATKPQIELSAQQRIENVKDAFEVKNFEQLNGKKIFLIDDVYTTGSTMEECAHVLRTSGVKSVWGIVIAREG